jgi:hypothetical protein
MKENPDTGINLLLSRSTKGIARFNIPIRLIAINSTHAFMTKVLRRDLGLTCVLEQKLAIEVMSYHPSGTEAASTPLRSLLRPKKLRFF